MPGHHNGLGRDPSYFCNSRESSTAVLWQRPAALTSRTYQEQGSRQYAMPLSFFIGGAKRPPSAIRYSGDEQVGYYFHDKICSHQSASSFILFFRMYKKAETI